MEGRDDPAHVTRVLSFDHYRFFFSSGGQEEKDFRIQREEKKCFYSLLGFNHPERTVWW